MQSIKRLCLLLIFALFATGAITAGQVLAADWYDTNWAYRQSITIDESMIPDNGYLSDFPVLIQRTSADNNPVFASARSDGYDILFTESDGITLLDHEIEKYDNSPGSEELDAWVRIPTLSTTADTIIYMYYGNITASNQENPQGVWDINYRGVWHLHDDFLDSTNQNDAMNSGSTDTTGKIADGQGFDGNDLILLLGGVGTGLLDAHAQHTISAWVNTNNSGSKQLVIAEGGRCYNSSGYGLYVNDGAGSSRHFIRTENTVSDSVTASALGTGSWHHLVGVWNGVTGELALYIDGVNVSSKTTSIASMPDPIDGWRLGGSGDEMDPIDGSYDHYFNGTIDEVRISDIVRSDKWIAASYNNQSSPLTFNTEGGEEPVLDLIVSDLSIPKVKKNRRGHIAKIFVDYRVMNQGSGDVAVASELAFYLSRDTVLDGSDTYVGTANIPALAPGDETHRLLRGWKKFKLSRPVFSSGTWYVLGKADAGDVNAETDENNNVTAAIVVGNGK